jgi:purine-binding chemotaxis protein CheW
MNPTVVDDPKKILRSRAEALARVPESEAKPWALLNLLEFKMAQERYAVETQYVEGVSPFRDLTPLPCTPPFIRGIVNVRGRILPVLDLTRYIGLSDKGLTDLHRIILVQSNGMEMGLLVDDIIGLKSISPDSLQPSLPTLGGAGSEFLKGITSDRVIVLDLGRLFSDPALVVNEEVT